MAGPDAFAGRRLDDALRQLQARGVRLVFSSELVTPEMRVRVEPRTTTPKQQLAELLEPHGLVGVAGPGGIILIVRGKTPRAERPHPAPPRPAASAPVGPIEASYREQVTVFARDRNGDELSPGIDRQLASADFDRHGGHVADDPLRVVQALPGVATGDDFRSDYSVRASAYRQAGVIIDGVAAPWLQHAALGRGDTSTLTMLRGDLVEEASLLVGAYARTDSSQLGPQLNLTLREGSRTERRLTLEASGISSTATAEGPLGSSGRGSWLVAARRSHNEWPVGRNDEQSTVFGFADVQSKIVHDVRPGQQFSFSLVAGMSNIEREEPNPFAPADGLNRAALASVAWRSAARSDTVVTQRVSWITHDFSNRNQTLAGASRGADGAVAYRVDVSRRMFRGVFGAGAQVRRVRGARGGLQRRSFGEGPAAPAGDIESSWLERAAHASFRRSFGPAITIDTGFRLAGSTLVPRKAVDRWLRAEWSMAPRWRLHGSTGVMHQFPAIEQLARRVGETALRPERATSGEIGIGHRLSTSVRLDATVFVRRERDVLREPDRHPRVIDGALAIDETFRFENALTGSSRGVELTLARQSATGLSGWIGYSYGVARHVDAARAEAFPADFDQRHAINITGAAALPGAAIVGLTFRGGTNVPIPGYFEFHNGQLVAGEERNRVRLPAYARLDLRAERTFHLRARRITAFVEALNVLNRVNLGLADGVVRGETGEAVGFTEQLFPRLLTAGLRVGF
jgi:TonB dependent receptor